VTEPASRTPSQPLFVTTIGLSAFLLFTLELFAGRLVLPVFGGAPSVWTTALCFFTATVFVGSLYAHAIDERLSPRAGALVHLGFTAVVVAAVLLGPRELDALRVPGLAPVLNVLWALALVAGPPALLLSTTTPLLSSWFAERGRDPWWLYAVSNAASLAGLLAYPLLIAPLVPLSVQRDRLAFMIVVLAALLVAVVATTWRSTPTTPAAEKPAPLPVRRQLTWLFAAFVPAGLLSAITTQLTVDAVSAPLIWVLPLAVYLVSLVVAFSRVGRRILVPVEWLAPAAATLLWLTYIARVQWPLAVILPMALLAFLTVAVAVHGRIALDRPDPAHLTRFYLVISAGGVLATAFVALAAPLLFSDVYEFPLLVIGALAALALLPGPPISPAETPAAALAHAAIRVSPLLAVGLLGAAVLPPSQALFVGVVLSVGAVVVFLGRTPRSLALASAAAIVALAIVFTPQHLARVRTFFGITEVRAEDGGAVHTEIHGTTLHGLQFTSGPNRLEPTAYFARSGPLGEVFDGLRSRAGSEPLSIGVVGLGVGTMAAYAQDGDELAFFEIDPAVVALAQDERYFTYLRDAEATPRVVLGDGRLTLAEEEPGTLDVVLLDAFSSDAVPTHLLTREAMEGYRRVLAPGGVLVFQLTNRTFDLVPAVAATARSLGLEARTATFAPTPQVETDVRAKPSTWLVVAAPEEFSALGLEGWSVPPDGPVLTDDQSDVLRLLRLR